MNFTLLLAVVVAMKATALLPVLVLIAGCASDTGELTTAARNAVFPPSLASRNAADAYVAASFAGGRVDVLEVQGKQFIVVFRHGSGRPIIGIAVYRYGTSHWELVAEPQLRKEDFMRAVAADGVIMAVCEKSGERFVLYDPNSKKG